MSLTTLKFTYIILAKFVLKKKRKKKELHCYCSASEDRKECKMKCRMVPPTKMYLTWGFHWFEKGKGCKIALREDPFGGERIMEGGPRWWEEASCKWYTFPHHIECTTTTLSAALMRKWHLNSSFTASSPFYHLHSSSDGTSNLRKALRHIGGGLGCQEEGYIYKRGEPPSGGIFFSLSVKRNYRMNREGLV